LTSNLFFEKAHPTGWAFSCTWPNALWTAGAKRSGAPASLRELTEPNGWVHFFASQAPLPLTIAD